MKFLLMALLLSNTCYAGGPKYVWDKTKETRHKVFVQPYQDTKKIVRHPTTEAPKAVKECSQSTKCKVQVAQTAVTILMW